MARNTTELIVTLQVFLQVYGCSIIEGPHGSTFLCSALVSHMQSILPLFA
jgi:hypothetical protein